MKNCEKSVNFTEIDNDFKITNQMYEQNINRSIDTIYSLHIDSQRLSISITVKLADTMNTGSENFSEGKKDSLRISQRGYALLKFFL
nr:hypothetical protein [Dinophyceae sp. MRD-151]